MSSKPRRVRLLLSLLAPLLPPLTAAHATPALPSCAELNPADDMVGRTLGGVVVAENARAVCTDGNRILDYVRPEECLCDLQSCPCGTGAIIKAKNGDLIVDRTARPQRIDYRVRSEMELTLHERQEHFRPVGVVNGPSWAPVVESLGWICWRLPEGHVFDKDHVYGLEQGRLVEFRPARKILKLERPQMTPVSCSLAPSYCWRHGAMLFVPKGAHVMRFFLWEVQTPDGKRVTGPYIGRIPLISSQNQEWFPSLELKKGYVFVAREIGIDGEVSEQTRIPFKLEEATESTKPCPR